MTWLDIQTPTTCWWLMLMTWHLTFTVYWSLISLVPHSNTHCVLMTHVDDLTCDIYCVLMTWCLLTYHVLMTLTYDTLLYNDSQPMHDLTSCRLTTHRWLDLTFNTHYVLITYVDDLPCDIYCVLMTWCPLTHHVLMTDIWQTPCSTMTHCPSMTWRLDVSLVTGVLTWHSNTHYVLMIHVDDLTSDIHCVLMTWCPLTHYVLMT